MKDLRNYINKVVNQHTETVDNDALWAGIEQKMEKPKKKRRFLPFLIWGISLSFVVLIISSLYLSSKEQNPNANNIALATEAKENQQVKTTKTNPQTEVSSSKSIASVESSENNTSSPSATYNKAGINEDLNISSKQVKENIEVFEESKQSQNLLPFVYPTQNKKEREIQKHPTQSDFTDNSKQKINTSIRDENLTAEDMNSNSAEQQNIISIERLQIGFSKITASLDLIYKRPKIGIQPVSSFAAPLFLKREKKNYSLLNSFTIYTQYGFGSKTIQGSSEYAGLRNGSEEMLEQLRFGIEADLFQFLDFTLYGGLSYASINDRLIWNETFFEDREITYLKVIRVLSDGSEMEIFGTDELPHIINNEALRYNSHRLISIPLGLRFGKEFSKIQLGVNFGLDLNYALSNIHTILNTDLELIETPVGDKWLKPSLHTGISADYSLSDRWFLHSKINYRNIKFENTSIGTESKENYSIYGIDLGLKFQF